MPDDIDNEILENAILPTFNPEVVSRAGNGKLVAYSRTSNLPLGPVIDILNYNGVQFVLIDIDQQMIFHAAPNDIVLRERTLPMRPDSSDKGSEIV